VDDQRGCCWLVSVLSLAAISDGIKLLTQRFLSEQIEGRGYQNDYLNQALS